MSAELRARLVAQALKEGFVAARFTRPDAVPEMPARLAAFLEAGYHGQMSWLAERSNWRGNPAALWPEARSVLMLAESYAKREVIRERLLGNAKIQNTFIPGREHIVSILGRP